MVLGQNACGIQSHLFLRRLEWAAYMAERFRRPLTKQPYFVATNFHADNRSSLVCSEDPPHSPWLNPRVAKTTHEEAEASHRRKPEFGQEAHDAAALGAGARFDNLHAHSPQPEEQK